MSSKRGPDQPIGVFDSGVGGLTVVREIKRILPYEDIVYFGDTAHLPYGAKSKETVIKLSIENILFLLRLNVKLICIACNTSSSVALSFIKEHFKIPIIGVIEPAVRLAINLTKNNRIGIIGTKATIQSRTYEKIIKEFNSKIEVFSCACPLFVPFVEEGITKGEILEKIARGYLEPLKKNRIDTLILGCTHYPLLKPLISKIMGRNVKLIDSTSVATQIKEFLLSENLLNKKHKPKLEFYVSDDPESFKNLGSKFLGFPLKEVRKINHV